MGIVALITVFTGYYGDYNDLYLNPADPGPSEAGLRMGVVFANASTGLDYYYYDNTPLIKTGFELYLNVGLSYAGISAFVASQRPGLGLFMKSPKFKNVWISATAYSSYSTEQMWPGGNMSLWLNFNPDIAAYVLGGYGLGLGKVQFSVWDTTNYEYATAFDTTYQANCFVVGVGVDYTGLEHVGFTIGAENVFSRAYEAREYSSGIRLLRRDQEFLRVKIGFYLKR